MRNSLNRAFQQTEIKRVVVSDLTYVRFGSHLNCACTLIDLFNREIIGHSAGVHKDVALVSRVFASVEDDLRDIVWFHTVGSNITT